MARRFFKHQHPVVHKAASGTWGFRYYDRDGKRRRAGGFKTKGEAREAADALVLKLRTGMEVAPVGQTLTFAALVEKYLAQHDASDARLAKMRWALAKATAAFGAVPHRRS